MINFDTNHFYQRLHEMPNKHILPAGPEYSEYLQKEVFDPLIRGETIDLANLDWNAFALRHVLIEYLYDDYAKVERDLLQRTRQLLRHAEPAWRLERKYF